MTANVDDAEQLFKARRYDDKIDVHIEFHNLLARATRNAVMVMLMGAVMEVMRDFAHAAGGSATISPSRRAPPARRMRKRDGDEAVRAMTDHLKICAGAIATGSGRRASGGG